MTRRFEDDERRIQYRDLWLSEMGMTVREVPRDIRAGWAAVAQARDEQFGEDRRAGEAA